MFGLGVESPKSRRSTPGRLGSPAALARPSRRSGRACRREPSTSRPELPAHRVTLPQVTRSRRLSRRKCPWKPFPGCTCAPCRCVPHRRTTNRPARHHRSYRSPGEGWRSEPVAADTAVTAPCPQGRSDGERGIVADLAVRLACHVRRRLSFGVHLPGTGPRPSAAPAYSRRPSASALSSCGSPSSGMAFTTAPAAGFPRKVTATIGGLDRAGRRPASGGDREPRPPRPAMVRSGPAPCR